MSGILNKKDSFIDYKLTENGRKQIQNNDINYMYYSFSDSSIVYSGEQNELYDEQISNSEFHYIPFEVSTDPKNYINPEFNLTKKLDLNYIDNDILISNQDSKFLDLNTKFTLSSQIKSKKLLNNIDVLIQNKEIIFSKKDVLEEYDFQPNSTTEIKDFNFLINYPTIDSLNKNLNEIPIISNDNRFSYKLNNKILNPINLNGSSILSQENQIENKENEGLSYIFNSLKGIVINETTRENVLNEVINKIDKLNKDNIFYLKYEIKNKDKKLKMIPELHSINQVNGIEEKKKLAFLYLGSFKNSLTNKFFDIYLIGKIILNRNYSQDYIENANRLKINISLEYSFINLFTLIAE